MIKYTDEDDDLFKIFYEEYGNWSEVQRQYEKSYGRKPDISNMKNRLKNKAIVEKWNFDKWENQHSKTNDYRYLDRYRQKYTENDVKVWIKLFEKIHTFNGVSKKYNKLTGIKPKSETIESNIKNYYERNSLDFDSWFKKYHKYPMKLDLPLCQTLYEELGSFSAIARYFLKLRKKNQIPPSRNRIIRNLRKFIEKDRNFEKWVTTYGISDFEEEEELWEELFEELGSFLAVANYIKKYKLGKNVSDETIRRRLPKKFLKEGRDFNVWYDKYSYRYSNEDVKNWINLFQDEGSFHLVAKKFRKNLDKIVSVTTIIRRIRERFKEENRDYDIWFIKYFNPQIERSQVVGKYIHDIHESDFIYITRTNKLITFSEIYFKSNDYHQIDLAVFRDEEFYKEIELDQELVVLNEYITMINIDITTTTNPYYVREKFFKGYQGKNRFLIIVLLAYENADSDFWGLVKDSFGNISVPYAENIKILTSTQFSDLFNYSGISLKNYKFYNQLYKKALRSESALEQLKILTLRKQRMLKKFQKDLMHEKNLEVFPASQEEFERYRN